MDYIILQDINELPIMAPLETQPTSSKKRKGSPVTSQTLPPKAVAAVLSDDEREPLPTWSSAISPVFADDKGTGPGSPCDSPPSPTMFVECGGIAQSSPDGHPLKGAELIRVFNYGSDEEDGPVSDEEADILPSVVLPRGVCWAYKDDDDEDDDLPPLPYSPTQQHPATEGVLHEPNDFFNFEWRSFSGNLDSAQSRRENFSHKVGPTAPYSDPYNAFIAVWDRPFMEYIAKETNLYAQQLESKMLNSGTIRPQSRILSWKDTTADELYIYFGIILATGLVVKGTFEAYWNSSADIFQTAGFSAYMSLRRFEILSKCLHFSDNDKCAPDLSPADARIVKIQSLVDDLNDRFSQLYNLDRNIALDESLIQWKGMLNINQFIANKAAKVGIKTYEICESRTGYLWRFMIHAHKPSEMVASREPSPITGTTPALVLKLLHGLENRGHTIWMDNYFNSPALARTLKSLGFDCVGTLRTNRQFIPHEVASLKNACMPKGSVCCVTSGDVDIIVWMDRARVALLSTYHGNGKSTEDGVNKPTVVRDYNVCMGGVDKKDQMLAGYPIERKRTKVWYKKLFRRLLNVSVLNAYILYNESPKAVKLKHRTFRERLVRSLLEKHMQSSNRCGPATIPPFYTVPLPERRDIKEHHIAKGKNRRKFCKVCKKRGPTYCPKCDVSLCLEPCFVTYHVRT